MKIKRKSLLSLVLVMALMLSTLTAISFVNAEPAAEDQEIILDMLEAPYNTQSPDQDTTTGWRGGNGKEIFKSVPLSGQSVDASGRLERFEQKSYGYDIVLNNKEFYIAYLFAADETNLNVAYSRDTAPTLPKNALFNFNVSVDCKFRTFVAYETDTGKKGVFYVYYDSGTSTYKTQNHTFETGSNGIVTKVDGQDATALPDNIAYVSSSHTNFIPEGDHEVTIDLSGIIAEVDPAAMSVDIFSVNFALDTGWNDKTVAVKGLNFAKPKPPVPQEIILDMTQEPYNTNAPAQDATSGWRGTARDNFLKMPMSGQGSSYDTILDIVVNQDGSYKLELDNEWFFFTYLLAADGTNYDVKYTSDMALNVPMNARINLDIESNGKTRPFVIYQTDTGKNGVFYVYYDQGSSSYKIQNHTFVKGENGYITSVDGVETDSLPDITFIESDHTNYLPKGTRHKVSLDLSDAFAATDPAATSVDIYSVNLTFGNDWANGYITVYELSFSKPVPASASQSLEEAKAEILAAFDNYEVTSSSTVDNLKATLEAAVNDEEITVDWVAGCAILPPMNGCKDGDNVLIEGMPGEVVGGLRLTKGSESLDVVFQKELPPYMETFTFASYSKDSDFLIDDNGVVIEYTGNAEAVIFPEGITGIDSYTFALESSKQNIRMMVIPEGVNDFTYRHFAFMPNLEIVILPDSATNLGLPEKISDCDTVGYVFFDCPKLRYVRLPSTLRQIPAGTFMNTIVESINLPPTLESIGSYAFSSGSSSQIQSGVTVSPKLPVLVFPKTVKYLGTSLFSSSTTKELYVLNPDIVHVSNMGIDNVAFPYSVLRGNGTVFANSDSATKDNIDEGNAVPATHPDYWMVYQNKGSFVAFEEIPLANQYIMEKWLLRNSKFSNNTTAESLLNELKAACFNDDISIESDSFEITKATANSDGSVSGVFTLEYDGIAFELGFEGKISKLSSDPSTTDPTTSDPGGTTDPSDDGKTSPDTGDVTSPIMILLIAVSAIVVMLLIRKREAVN